MCEACIQTGNRQVLLWSSLCCLLLHVGSPAQQRDPDEAREDSTAAGHAGSHPGTLQGRGRCRLESSCKGRGLISCTVPYMYLWAGVHGPLPLSSSKIEVELRVVTSKAHYLARHPPAAKTSLRCCGRPW